MWKVDLNCDMGEAFGVYTIAPDADIMPLISSANIACGWHAGDPHVMRRSVELALEHDVAIGAHPGYPDLLGFGRRNLSLTPAELKDYVTYQVGALAAFVKAAGGRLHHVKAHGAMYNQAAADPNLARAFAEAIAACDEDLIVVGLANSHLLSEAKKLGLSVASEVFADRGYLPNGALMPRHLPGAVLHDPDLVVSRVLTMVKEGTVQANDGSIIQLRADTICVHGDTPEALAHLKALRQALAAAQIKITRVSGGDSRV
jgi:UPF0271 protein